MIYDSTLTSKFQATVPKAVRNYLGVTKGDHLLYAIDEKQHTVSIRKATPLDLGYLKSIQETLTEWHSDWDEDAYGNL